MANIQLALAARNAATSAIVGRVDLDTNPGRIKIYTGTMPATPNTAPSGGNTLLATVVLQKPAFAAASAGQATAATPIASVTAAQTGTASWFRMEDGAGNVVLDGSIGTSSSFAMQVNTTSFVSGVNVSVNSLAVSTPQTC